MNEQPFRTTRQMHASGWSRNRLAEAVSGGTLLRPRVGQYCSPATPVDLVRAVRVGGVATATTAAEALGLWTPPDDRLHVAVPANAPRLRDPDDGSRMLAARKDVVAHWEPTMTTSRTITGIAPVPTVLVHAFLALKPDYALAVLDSALHLRHLRTDQLAALAAALPHRLRWLMGQADALSESGLETIARFRLRQIGLAVIVQRRLPSVGRIDLLVEGRLLVELDGREWHGDDFERDRRRDTATTLLRYRTLRFTYAQVLFDWPTVEAAVLAALAL